MVIKMCGITGFTGKYKNKEEILDKMMNRIAHRGPDASGKYIDDYIALGHRRLSIIDEKTGNQPLYNESNTMAIVFNGEIYNYQELKKELINLGHIFKTNSDTEVILHGYEEWGDKVPTYLRGMFAFAIWNKENNALFLARDPIGIKPLYYANLEKTFLFGSEIKALLEFPEITKTCNIDLLANYLVFGFNANYKTFFKDIYELTPGCTLLLKNKRILKKKYYSFKFEKQKIYNPEKKIEQALLQSIKYHKISDVPIGSFLSSGIDSSYITALGDIKKTYTVGYRQESFSEIACAKQLAKTLNIENTSKIITKEEYMQTLPEVLRTMDEPFSNPSTIAIYTCASLASKDLKVILSGEGADELFAGYLTYLEEVKHTWYMFIPYFLRRSISSIAEKLPEIKGMDFLCRRGKKLEDSYIGVGRICQNFDTTKILRTKELANPKKITKSIYEEYNDCSSLEKRQMIDLHIFLSKDFLPSIDRCCMHFGVEARTPFLDKEVFAIASKLRMEDKIKKRQTKVSLRNAAARILPEDITNKKKLGFPVPLKEWMKDDDMQKELKEKFSSSTASIFFNRNYILKLLEKYKKGQYKNYKLLWTIYIFIRWYDIYFQ